MGASGRSLTKLIAGCDENFNNLTAIPTECGFNPVLPDLPSTPVAIQPSKKYRWVYRAEIQAGTTSGSAGRVIRIASSARTTKITAT